MHELSLCYALVEEIERCTAQYGPCIRVKDVTLRVGKLRSIVPETMYFAFAVATQGTRAEGATLWLEEVPVQVACGRCHMQHVLVEMDFVCPYCGGPVDIIAGNDIVLVSLDIDGGDAS